MSHHPGTIQPSTIKLTGKWHIAEINENSYQITDKFSKKELVGNKHDNSTNTKYLMEKSGVSTCTSLQIGSCFFPFTVLFLRNEPT